MDMRNVFASHGFCGDPFGENAEGLRLTNEGQLSSVDEWIIIPDEETEAQRGEVTCPRAHSQKVADLGFELRQPAPLHQNTYPTDI